MNESDTNRENTVTTKTIDTAQLNQSVDLRELAARYTELRRESAKSLAGPCPKCGGDNRFYCQATFFACRHCYEINNGKPHDAIGFIMWLNGVDFKTAAATLTNAPAPTTQTRRTPAPKRTTEQPQDWTRKAAAIVATAHKRLMNDADTEAAAGRDYLEGRGLQPHTWQAFKLGFKPDVLIPVIGQEAPAIAIPWYKGGKLCAIRYRFIHSHKHVNAKGEDKIEKITSETGSRYPGLLFGGQALDNGSVSLSTLLICEGEINCCSIWQACHDSHLSVLSLGSDTATITPAMAIYAKQFQTVIVWLDEGKKAQAAMTALEGAHPIQSPNKKDANDFLRTERLGGFLAHHRFQAARNAQEQERLLWYLWDAAQLPMGADDYTLKMIDRIAKAMDKSL